MYATVSRIIECRHGTPDTLSSSLHFWSYPVWRLLCSFYFSPLIGLQSQQLQAQFALRGLSSKVRKNCVVWPCPAKIDDATTDEATK